MFAGPVEGLCYGVFSETFARWKSASKSGAVLKKMALRAEIAKHLRGDESTSHSGAVADATFVLFWDCGGFV